MKAVFLDRDGTVIEDTHYPRDPARVRWLPGAVEGLRAISAKGFRLFLISNQSGVGSGKIRYSEFLAVHSRFMELVDQAGIVFEECHYCLDVSNRPSDFRKPAVGMIPLSFHGGPVDFSSSYVVGDRLSDLLVGQALGVRRSFLVSSGYWESTQAAFTPEQKAQFPVCADLLEISKQIQ